MMSSSGGGRSEIKTPRPAPIPVIFSNSQPTFSTKRARRTYSRIPQQPSRPHYFKTAPPQNRYGARTLYERWSDQKPHLISFKTHSESYLEQLTSSHQLNRSYDESQSQSYFHQCFEKVAKIGEGSFGEVFKVRSRETGDLYAVKRAVERFRGSADRAEKLREVQKHEELPKGSYTYHLMTFGHKTCWAALHRNLVEFMGAWEEKGRLYIQTELCSSSLADMCERVHNIPENMVWKYLVDLLLAVKHLDEHGLVHMDIKPDNIFISQDGFCKLGDFGLVIDLHRSNLRDLQEGDAKYLAPELLREECGKGADIFSLGISILEVSSDLDLPTSGEEWQMLRRGHLPLELMTHLSDDMISIIKMMLNPDPYCRPSAEDLLNLPCLASHFYRRQANAYCLQVKNVLKSLAASVWLLVYLLMTIVLSPITRAVEWYREVKGRKKLSSTVRPPCFLSCQHGMGRTPEIEDRLAVPLRFDDSSSDDDEDVDVHELSSIRSGDSPLDGSRGRPEMIGDDSNTSSSSGSEDRDRNRNIAGYSPVVTPFNSTPAQKWRSSEKRRRRMGDSHELKDRLKKMLRGEDLRCLITMGVHRKMSFPDCGEKIQGLIDSSDFT